MRPARTFLPHRAVTVLAASLLLVGPACSGDDAGPAGRPSETPSPSSSSTDFPSPTPTGMEPSPAESPSVIPRPVPASDAFERLRGYVLAPVSAPVRRRAKRSFEGSTGENLYGFAMKRAVPKEHPSRVSSILVLSIDLVDGETAETFQTKAIEALSQQVSSVGVEIGGRTVYISKTATERGLSRLFYFFHDTVVVQIFGKREAVRDLAGALIESEAKES